MSVQKPLVVRSDLLNAAMSGPLSGAAVFAAYVLADEIDRRVHRREIDLRVLPDEGMTIELDTAELRRSRDDNDGLRPAIARLRKVEWSGHDDAGVAFDTVLVAQVKWPMGGRRVRISMPSEAVRMLAQRALFAQLERHASLYLSGHSARLYGLLADKRRLKRQTPNGWAWWTWDLDELRALLGVQHARAYTKSFADFRRRVLDPATTAIAEAGVVDVRWEAERGARGVVKRVRFEWRFKSAVRVAEAIAEVERHGATSEGSTLEPETLPLVSAEPQATPALDWWGQLTDAERNAWADCVGRLIPGTGFPRRDRDLAEAAWAEHSASKEL